VEKETVKYLNDFRVSQLFFFFFFVRIPSAATSTTTTEIKT
jgi:hypothetical protein